MTTQKTNDRLDFSYQALPMRVKFGVGSLKQLPSELDALDLKRVLVICSPEQQSTGQMVADALGDRAVGILPEAVMHVPEEAAQSASDKAKELGADGCVTVGGGSAIGLGKAIALKHGLPIIAVPTTYAGSEMTPVWGLTSNGRKQTGKDPRVLPTSVVYDPSLSATLPVGMSVTSGINAIAHAVEALYAPDATPIISLMAEEGVKALANALPLIVNDPEDLEVRSQALYGSWLCGATLGATTMSLHHKLCHALGGTLNLPHAQTHTVVLPYALAFNQVAAPEAKAALSRALSGAQDPAVELWHLGEKLGAPRSLAELGMKQEDIQVIAEEVVGYSYGNPRPIDLESIRGLLTDAWQGNQPKANPGS